MRVVIKDSYHAACCFVADYIIARINAFVPDKKKHFVLGLPTGSTPLGVYECLIEHYKKGTVSFKDVVTFNMDEYVGLDSKHEQSYHYFMWENFFKHIDIQQEHVHILNGRATDVKQECDNYEKAILENGGIDLFLGGVGADGHIAFNEPGTSLASRTGCRQLAYSTIQMNSRFFNNDLSLVPTEALTVGVQTVMDANEVIIMATGQAKAQAVYHAVEDGVNHLWTVSALQMHERGILVCDEDACDELKFGTVKYFKRLESYRSGKNKGSIYFE